MSAGADTDDHVHVGRDGLNIVSDVFKLREERDYSELYPDLDIDEQLPVFIVNQNSNKNTNGYNASPSETKETAPILPETINPKTLTDPIIKFPKALVELGFKDYGKNYNNCAIGPYQRPFQISQKSQSPSGSATVENIAEFLNHNKNRVAYDMDEQDYLYLKMRNEAPENVIKITPEIFEILFTTLENEWEKLDRRMNAMVHNGAQGIEQSLEGHKFQTMDVESSDRLYGNDDGVVPGSFYDQKCAVCNDSDCDNSNAIVFCDGCDIAVHQDCYGIAFIPEGEWLCRKCMINKTQPTACAFCPSKTGAFKQLDNGLWSHVICALWINEVYFANPIYMEPIEGMTLIPRSRWKLICYICRQKVGACVQCSNRSCFQAYHVTCAKRAGLYMELTHGVQGAIANKSTLKTFCDKHSPLDYSLASQTIDGIHKTRRFYKDKRIIDDKNAQLSNKFKAASRLSAFKWKTDANTPIAPKLFSDILVALMLNLKVERQIRMPLAPESEADRLSDVPHRTREEVSKELTSISDEMCRYWCLKRESKRGAPLVRKNNNLLSSSSIVYNMSSSGIVDGFAGSSEEERKVENKVMIDFAQFLLSDLGKVILFSDAVLKRQVVFQELQNTNEELMKKIYFPLGTLIQQVCHIVSSKADPLNQLLKYKRVGSTEIALTLAEMMEKNSLNLYASVADFERDVYEFHGMITRLHRRTSSIFKVAIKWLREFKKIVEQIRASEQELVSNCSPSGQLRLPHVLVRGRSISFERYDSKKATHDEELSDADDVKFDELQEETNSNLLKKFLNAKF